MYTPDPTLLTAQGLLQHVLTKGQRNARKYAVMWPRSLDEVLGIVQLFAANETVATILSSKINTQFTNLKQFSDAGAIQFELLQLATGAFKLEMYTKAILDKSKKKAIIGMTLNNQGMIDTSFVASPCPDPN